MTKNESNQLLVTLVKSINGRSQNHKDCIRSLGLRRLHHTVELQDNPTVRGLINKVNYMIKVETKVK